MTANCCLKNALRLKSPAKVNLFLRIVKRRSDGYHELASLFQAIDLFDTLDFSMDDVDTFTCSDPTLPNDDSNLVLKALRLFKTKTGIRKNFKIHLEKLIPQQAGLGGGSGNAATTLWALNRLCGDPATESQLMQWGSEIGSDISFFLSTGTAYCTGRGEIIESLAPLDSTLLSIIKPPIGLSTPQVYSKVDVAALFPRDPKTVLQNFLKADPDYFNDLEPAAFNVLPELKKFKESLLKDGGFSTVLLCGSGSSFFCLGNGNPNAVAGYPNFKNYSAHFVNRSPGSWY